MRSKRSARALPGGRELPLDHFGVRQVVALRQLGGVRIPVGKLGIVLRQHEMQPFGEQPVDVSNVARVFQR